MAYLSSITLNPLRSGAQRLIRNPRALHAAVEASLPPERSGRVLWRLEQRPHEVQLLVLTPDVPTFEHIIEQAGWMDNEHGAPRTADMAPLLAEVTLGREFSFRTRVNPTQRSARGVARGSRGVRHGHRTAAHQLEWFLTRTRGDDLPWGFELADPGTTGSDTTSASPPSVSLVERAQVQFDHGRNVPPVTLSTATFEGRLRVTDAAVFREKLVQGIGSGKAYGCGLITLAAGHVVAR